ncbi:ABC transporter, membrane fusion protein (HlyD family) [Campylobacter iguaniorum]|uniref:HlyD family efflux transporter periplasmic adaptor subunit n=1 Tax=Campylobacter iguaniorum TaxID=1244531 RepID=UPI0007C8C683|nr:HlyD family efflux transporter periplasmic adaptor subunit [Campylobacter iguaniorum]ANE35309.1 ABC transporter, membrane fusion protein (HlyD family) [Campylobacter iguaniorum]
MKKLLFIILSLAVIILLYFTYKNGGFNGQKEDIFYGNVDTKTVDLSFRFLGQISSIAKEEGESVKIGEEIARLNDEYLLNSLESVKTNIALEKIKLDKLENGYRKEDIASAKASFEVGKANLAKAKDSFDRQEKLIKTNSTSQEAYMNAKSNLEAMRANLALAKAGYEKLQNGYEKADIKAQVELIKSLEIKKQAIELDLKNSIIRSPYNGILQKKYKELGSTVVQNEPVAQIARMDKFFIRAYANEPDLKKLELGEDMLIYSDARDEPYRGRLSFISSVAEFTPKHIQTMELRSELVYRFEIIIDDFDTKLKQGMPVHIKFSNDKSN